MANEIERKFILNEEVIIDTPIDHTKLIKQAYIASSDTKIVRARLSVTNDNAIGYLTIKGRGAGISRLELEYEIPSNEALELINAEESVISKERTVRLLDGYVFEFDDFKDKLNGLKIVEIEFETERDALNFDSNKYDFLGKEISEDEKYSNYALSYNPLYALDKFNS